MYKIMYKKFEGRVSRRPLNAGLRSSPSRIQDSTRELPDGDVCQVFFHPLQRDSNFRYGLVVLFENQEVTRDSFVKAILNYNYFCGAPRSQ